MLIEFITLCRNDTLFTTSEEPCTCGFISSKCKKKKGEGKGVEVSQRDPVKGNSQSMVSGVQAFFEEEGSVVPETPTNLMGDLRRKKAEAEHLLKVDKEVGVTFTMADGTVVDRLVAMEDVGSENRERREVFL